MKIKCPVCFKIFYMSDVDDTKQITNHLENHSNTNAIHNVFTEYTKLLFKIHEKIEEIEQPDYHTMFKTLPVVKQTVTRILKSLLE